MHVHVYIYIHIMLHVCVCVRIVLPYATVEHVDAHLQTCMVWGARMPMCEGSPQLSAAAVAWE